MLGVGLLQPGRLATPETIPYAPLPPANRQAQPPETSTPRGNSEPRVDEFDLHHKSSPSCLEAALNQRKGANEDQELALKNLDRVLEHESSSPDHTRAALLNLRGQILYDLGHFEEAAKALMEARVLGSPNPGLLQEATVRATEALAAATEGEVERAKGSQAGALAEPASQEVAVDEPAPSHAAAPPQASPSSVMGNAKPLIVGAVPPYSFDFELFDIVSKGDPPDFSIAVSWWVGNRISVDRNFGCLLAGSVGGDRVWNDDGSTLPIANLDGVDYVCTGSDVPGDLVHTVMAAPAGNLGEQPDADFGDLAANSIGDWVSSDIDGDPFTPGFGVDGIQDAGGPDGGVVTIEFIDSTRTTATEFDAGYLLKGLGSNGGAYGVKVDLGALSIMRETPIVDPEATQVPALVRTARRRAVIVGVDDYVSWDFGPLDYAVIDAGRVVEVFDDLGYATETLINEQATREGILGGLRREARDSRAGDHAIFYFAGHGFSDSAGRLAVVTADGFALSLEEIETALEVHRGNAVVVIDSCFDVRDLPFERYAISGGDTDLTDATGDVTFLMAGSPGQPALESNSLQGGLFTHAFTKVIETIVAPSHDGGADLDFVRLFLEISRQTRDLARTMYSAKQSPVIAVASAEHRLRPVGGSVASSAVAAARSGS